MRFREGCRTVVRLGGRQICSKYFEIMERETGIEPATNSLEGCDSTTELLPPAF